MSTAAEIMGPDWQSHVRRMKARKASHVAYQNSREGRAAAADRQSLVRDYLFGLIVVGKIDEYRQYFENLHRSFHRPGPVEEQPAPVAEPEILNVADDADLAAEIGSGKGLGNLGWLNRGHIPEDRG